MSVISFFFFFLFQSAYERYIKTPRKIQSAIVHGGHGDWKQGLKMAHYHNEDSLDLDFIF